MKSGFQQFLEDLIDGAQQQAPASNDAPPTPQEIFEKIFSVGESGVAAVTFEYDRCPICGKEQFLFTKLPS